MFHLLRIVSIYFSLSRKYRFWKTKFNHDPTMNDQLFWRMVFEKQNRAGSFDDLQPNVPEDSQG